MVAMVVSGLGTSNTGKGSRPRSRLSSPLDYCRPCTAASDAWCDGCYGGVRFKSGNVCFGVVVWCWGFGGSDREPPVTTTGLLRLVLCCEYLRLAHDAMDAVVVSGPGSSNTGKGSRPESRPSPPLDYCRPCTLL
ncbi:hypothetical protein J6590_050599 [Homalodisca vitripennis]|nr:hypothetical protein J6590_050599 [Homalodisca vitripennis]